MRKALFSIAIPCLTFISCKTSPTQYQLQNTLTKTQGECSKPDLSSLNVKKSPGSYDKYEYLDNIEKVPFDTGCNDLSYVNAWHLAEYSALAYNSPGDYVSVNNKNVQIEHFFGGDTDSGSEYDKYLNFENVYYYEGKLNENYTNVNFWILEDADKLIISFRGTEPTSIYDWATDATHRLVTAKNIITENNYEGVEVHEGFQLSLVQAIESAELKYSKSSSADSFGKLLKNLISKHDRIYLTGHSLGGALSTLFSYYLAKEHPNLDIFTYNIGSPMVGNKAFANDYKKLTNVRNYRFVFNSDLVTELFGEDITIDGVLYDYRHVGETIHISTDPSNSGKNVQVYQADKSTLIASQTKVINQWVKDSAINNKLDAIDNYLLTKYTSPGKQSSGNDLADMISDALVNLDYQFKNFVPAATKFLTVGQKGAKVHLEKKKELGQSFTRFLIRGGFDHSAENYFISIWNSGILEQENSSNSVD